MQHRKTTRELVAVMIMLSRSKPTQTALGDILPYAESCSAIQEDVREAAPTLEKSIAYERDRADYGVVLTLEDAENALIDGFDNIFVLPWATRTSSAGLTFSELSSKMASEDEAQNALIEGVENANVCPWTFGTSSSRA